MKLQPTIPTQTMHQNHHKLAFLISPKISNFIISPKTDFAEKLSGDFSIPFHVWSCYEVKIESPQKFMHWVAMDKNFTRVKDVLNVARRMQGGIVIVVLYKQKNLHASLADMYFLDP